LRVTNGIKNVLATRSPAATPLTPVEALAKLFMDNADEGCNVENDTLIVELLNRMRSVQALTANPNGQ
jgi:hypothetical protein